MPGETDASPGASSREGTRYIFAKACFVFSSTNCDSVTPLPIAAVDDLASAGAPSTFRPTHMPPVTVIIIASA